MNQVEEIYQRKLRITSPLQNKVNAYVLQQGAYGSKIIGPNWGRMLLVYAPENTKEIASNIRKKFGFPVRQIRLSQKGFRMKEE
jgi:galactokinase/mevalonate kinase-like predicted kinase